MSDALGLVGVALGVAAVAVALWAIAHHHGSAPDVPRNDSDAVVIDGGTVVSPGPDPTEDEKRKKAGLPPLQKPEPPAVPPTDTLHL